MTVTFPEDFNLADYWLFDACARAGDRSRAPGDRS
jgi:hypothetical protein